MITVHLDEGMHFVARTRGEHEISMDASEKGGGANRGPRPVDVLLSALGGCTGMDVIAILRKMRSEPRDLEVEVHGEQEENRPHAFRRIHLVYRASGDVPEETLRKAVNLSLERYCPVANTLNGVAEITSEIRVEAG